MIVSAWFKDVLFNTSPGIEFIAVLPFENLSGDPDQEFNSSLELDSNNSLSLRCMWSIHSIKGDYDKAIDYASRFYRSQGNIDMALDLERLYESGDYLTALKNTADQSMDHRKVEYIPSMRIARLYTFCGEYDKAIDLQEEAYDERFPSMFSLNVDPNWDVLKVKPDFQELVKKMNLPLN